jgi:spermidine synthase
MFMCLVAITLSAFLLFLVQPLSAKALLPLFGGVPAVWNICIVYFQGMLLIGYLYVHLATRFLKTHMQRTLHFMIVGISFFFLPLIWQQLHLQNGMSPTINVFYLLLTKLSLPLFILSSTGPLVQYWFSQTDRLQAKDPYFLYSASNCGSLAALLGFPFLFEPLFGLQRMSVYWSLLYGIFAISLLVAALQCKTKVVIVKESVATVDKINWHQRMRWLLLSFAPSCLLVAVTQYITTEVAAVPLFWILPLAVYLLVFIIAFSHKPIVNHQWMLREQALFLIFPLISLSKMTITLPAWQLIPFHLLGFFALIMVCLGELVAARPDKSYLTEFYLWMAFGGFLGGLFASIISPLIFNGVYEYYIAFCLCILMRPWGKSSWNWSVIMMPAAIGVVLFINQLLMANSFSIVFEGIKFLNWLDLLVVVSVITVILCYEKNTLKYFLNLMVLFLFSQALPGFHNNDLIWQSRNFFGVTRIYKNDESHLHLLMNGTTLHGLQMLNASVNVNRLTAYYKPILGVVDILGKNSASLNVAIAGLGTGILSCQFRSSDQVTFFEIDNSVVKIANNTEFFTYLKSCPPQKIILGDARLNIAESSPHLYNMIIIDVFTSDAIPVHMLTREAVQLYLQKLVPGGLMVFNISNRHVDLRPVLETVANQLNLQILWYRSMKSDNVYELPSEWVILTNNSQLVGKIEAELHWKLLKGNRSSLLWTDDFSNILRVLK